MPEEKITATMCLNPVPCLRYTDKSGQENMENGNRIKLLLDPVAYEGNRRRRRMMEHGHKSMNVILTGNARNLAHLTSSVQKVTGHRDIITSA